MLNVNPIINQVKRNCDITDARFVLKKFAEKKADRLLMYHLRDLYMSEIGIKPWEKISFQDQNYESWLKNKVAIWKSLKDEKRFSKITINGREYRPSDRRGINAQLNPEGYFYYSGRGPENKISFLLAQLDECTEENSYDVYILGKELAHDLSRDLSNLAFHLGGYLVGRKTALRYYLWRKINQLVSTKKDFSKEKRILGQALQEYGLSRNELTGNPDDVDRKVRNIVQREIQTRIHHELGHEIVKRITRTFPYRPYYKLVNLAPGTDLEWFVTAVDEVLADTSEHKDLKGGLSYIIDQRNKGSLLLHAHEAMLGLKVDETYWKFYGKIFPEFIHASEDFQESEDWEIVNDAKIAGRERATELARQLIENKNDISSVQKIYETAALR